MIFFPERSSDRLHVVDLQFVNGHQQETAHSRWICQMFSYSVAPPIRPFCMNRLDVDSADSAVSRTVLCSFLLGLEQIDKKKKKKKV